jgi:hypothetical protein
VGDVISFIGFRKLIFGYLFLILVVWLVWNYLYSLNTRV